MDIMLIFSSKKPSGNFLFFIYIQISPFVFAIISLKMLVSLIQQFQIINRAIWCLICISLLFAMSSDSSFRVNLIKGLLPHS
jgi:amino acid permease